MTNHLDVRNHYESMFGKPEREAFFTKGDFAVSVLKWLPSTSTRGVILYATAGLSNYPLAAAEPTHRQEFFIGFSPGFDDIASPLAELAMFSRTAIPAVTDRHIYRAPSGTPRFDGFLLLTSPDDGLLPAISTDTGDHVEFILAIPLFALELDSAARDGIDAILQNMERQNVPYWHPDRKPFVGTAPPS